SSLGSIPRPYATGSPRPRSTPGIGPELRPATPRDWRSWRRRSENCDGPTRSCAARRLSSRRSSTAHRKGVVEKNNHTAAQRWWRTLADATTAEQAQASLEAFAIGQDSRRRE